MTEQGPYFIGFDVGTGSARAALLSQSGKLIAESTHPTITFRDPHDHTIFEQSLTDIWKAIRLSSITVLKESGVSKEDVRGIGFDATCSLAVTDLDGNPAEVSKGENLGLVLDHQGEVGKDKSMILWADHRAEEEATLINSTGNVVLDYVGGTMSARAGKFLEYMDYPSGWRMGVNGDLEMEIPKTLWLKKHMRPERFDNCQFFDLPDYLTYRSTGSLARSSNSLVSKFSYIPPDASESAPSSKGPHPKSDGWNEEFLTKIGLESVVERGLGQFGGKTGAKLDVTGDGGNGEESLVLTAGLPIGTGLNKRAAEELGLLEGTAVGSGVIDAYAGWVGTIAARSTDVHDPNPQETLRSMAPSQLVDSTMRLAAVAGTSTCHIVQSPEGVFVDGVWGPYKNAIFPGFWMNEGGQSSTGQLIDFMITTHPAYPKLLQVAKEQGKNIHEVLGDKLEELKDLRKAETLTHLTKDLHLYPDLHGNRSPLADNRMRGSIVGMALDSTLGDLALKFNVTLEAIALQTRHIVDEMNSKGHKIDSIYMSGGQVKNKRLMWLLSSICRMPVILPPSSSAAVVSGAAMLGRFAYEVQEKLGGKPIGTMAAAKEAGKGMKERLWEIMAEMTPAGVRISPEADKREMALLDVKYQIFRENIDIQKRRQIVADVSEAEHTD